MSVERPSWAPSEVDITRPSVARVYDFYLGGSHNFESDRSSADAREVYPALPAVVRQNRAFLRRAVPPRRGGVDQFLDLGSGIPTVGNVHEVAQAARAGRAGGLRRQRPRRGHAQPALLATTGRGRGAGADIRDAEGPGPGRARRGLDLDRPVAVLAVAVLHFVPDDAGRPS